MRDNASLSRINELIVKIALENGEKMVKKFGKIGNK
jgi:hypothetical protein